MSGQRTDSQELPSPTTRRLEEHVVSADTDPLKHIDIAPLAGAGPSGLGAEHVTEMLGPRKKTMIRPLHRLGNAFDLPVDASIDGDSPQPAGRGHARLA